MARFLRWSFAVAALWLTACAFGGAAHAANAGIVSASSDQNLWFVIEEQVTKNNGVPRVFRLMHHAAAMPDATVSSEATLPKLAQMPEAMAAWESQLWIVNAAQPTQEHARRDVFTVRVRYDVTFNIYQHEPHDRLMAIEPLPAGGRLAGFVALATGPVALLMPTERGVSSVALPDGTKASDDELNAPRLLRLENGMWTELPLPASIRATDEVHIAASRAGDGALFVLASTSARRAASTPTRLHKLEGESWSSGEVPIDLLAWQGATSVLGECAVVLAERGTENASVVLLRSSSVHTVMEFPLPDVPWTMLGLAGDLRLVTLGSVNQVYMQRFDPITGEPRPREQFEAIRPSLAIMLHLLVLVVVVIVATIGAFLLARWRGESPLQLPEGWFVLGPFGRAMALLIDMVPAGLITMLLTHCDLDELLLSPIAVPRIDLAFPYLMMMGLTLLHTGVWELLHGESLGKHVVGARVTDEHGNRLSTRATLTRLAFKAIVLCVPVLVFPTIISRRGQGLPERASGAVVISKAETEQMPS